MIDAVSSALFRRVRLWGLSTQCLAQLANSGSPVQLFLPLSMEARFVTILRRHLDLLTFIEVKRHGRTRVPARWEVNVFKTLGLSLIMILLVCSHSAFGQAPPSGQQRILQPIIINGQQQEQGVMVVQNGTVQTFTCPYPQQYETVDQSSSGWACFEEATGMWLLHAQPPQQTPQTYQQRP